MLATTVLKRIAPRLGVEPIPMACCISVFPVPHEWAENGAAAFKTYHLSQKPSYWIFFFFKEVTALLHSDSGHLPPTLYAEFKEPPSHLPQFSLS